MLTWLQLTRLIADDALSAVCIVLHLRTADCKIAGVTDHIKWSVLACDRQYRRLHQDQLDTFEGTLTVSVPSSLLVLFQ